MEIHSAADPDGPSLPWSFGEGVFLSAKNGELVVQCRYMSMIGKYIKRNVRCL